MDAAVADRFAAAQEQFKGTIRTFAWNSYRQMPTYSVEDVEQELLVVLYECVLTYDPDKGAKFSTYFQGNAKRRVIDIIRYFNAKRRTAEGGVTTLSDEAVQAAVDDAISAPSAEDRALNIMELQEYVAKHGTADLMRIRNRRKAPVAA